MVVERLGPFFLAVLVRVWTRMVILGLVAFVVGVWLMFTADAGTSASTFGTLLSGVGLTLAVTHAYYEFSSRSFNHEAQELRVVSQAAADAGNKLLVESGELRRLTLLLMRGIEQDDRPQWNRDDRGVPLGIQHNLETMPLSAKFGGGASATVTSADDGDALDGHLDQEART
ncbi:MAG: hypothetical protein QOF73_2723 [Thermomicrobiales bacterium]|nr:hypothetical protein [Thermomicrobiales bacterium]